MSDKLTITFIGKLRWVKKRPNEQMTIRNFEALRLMATALLYEQSEKWDLAREAQKDAQKELDDDLKDYLAGQQLTVPMATGNECFGFSQIGGIL